VHNGGVTTARGGFEVVFSKFNLAPAIFVEVKAPHVVQFEVIVLLTAKHVDASFVHATTEAGACGGGNITCAGEDIGSAAVTLVLASEDLIDTVPINVTAKAHKDTISIVQTSVVVSAKTLD
jgi:hypothetical protein